MPAPRQRLTEADPPPVRYDPTPAPVPAVVTINWRKATEHDQAAYAAAVMAERQQAMDLLAGVLVR